MTEKYHQMKLEEARRALINKNAENLRSVADAINIDFSNPDHGLGLKERIDDLEAAICELVEVIGT